ncbi:hypothetical protein [Sphaerimonospora thailandensis]|uniref:LppP/LprE lipoprotein n=1 Tax=Sphaerimonospora thailandensis TaxID=795644 RepID=A0A8J3R646_9ACTN|nr:hypothetical protein [Sphaerimonospora thailandensis]GIH69173.1 hypothetical protein Mth01_14260 [Sphaerimonospora thailandensis]
MRTFWLVALLFMAAACGDPSSTSASGSGSGSSGPDEPVGVPASTAAPSGSPSPVTPVGHTLNTHKVPWVSATPSGDGRSLDVVWWSGVEPCNVLDRVEVDEQADKVIVTLYEGQDPRSPDAVCILIAIQKTTKVELRAPLADRKIVDGAAS